MLRFIFVNILTMTPFIQIHNNYQLCFIISYKIHIKTQQSLWLKPRHLVYTVRVKTTHLIEIGHDGELTP